MFDTLNKRCKLNTMKDYVLINDKLKDRVVSNVYRGNVRSFENSSQMLREVLLHFTAVELWAKENIRLCELLCQ